MQSCMGSDNSLWVAANGVWVAEKLFSKPHRQWGAYVLWSVKIKKAKKN